MITEKNYYQDTKYLSHSHILAFQKCPFYFAEKYVNDNVVEIERDYFIYGSAVDVLLTEPEKFESRFLPVDRKIDISKFKETKKDLKKLNKEITEKQINKKPYKGLQDKQEKLELAIKNMEQAEDKDQITSTFYKNILESVKELERQKLYKMFKVEDMSQEIITIEACGSFCKKKGKLDYWNKEKKILADIKTTANIQKFNPRMYCQQLAYYRELASLKYGMKEEEIDCFLLVVSKEAIKHSMMYHISDDLLDTAKIEYEKTIVEMEKCKKTGFYMPCIKDNPEARQTICFNCEHYSACPFSQQREFTEVQ